MPLPQPPPSPPSPHPACQPVCLRWLQVIFSGRGVITGEQFPWHSPLFTWALVNIDAGTQNVVDGLTLVDSPEFHLASFTDRPTIRNGGWGGALYLGLECADQLDTTPSTTVKMMSWPFNSDGFDTGSGGLAEDLFIKANDDSIKIAGGSDSTVQVSVGAPFSQPAVLLVSTAPSHPFGFSTESSCLAAD
jgi:hypothetical protein